MIQPIISDFIEENAANEIVRHIDVSSYEDNVRNAELLFSAKSFPQNSKEGLLTLKQKDTLFIITENKSYLWGDIKLPKMDKVEIKTSEDIKFREFLAQYLIDSYDMESKILLIWQSKADKSETFTLSQGSFVKLCGHLNWRINVKLLKEVAPILKGLGVSTTDFYSLCRIHEEFNFEYDNKVKEKLDLRIKKLYKKYDGLSSIVDANLLPLVDSPEMNIIGWYLK